MREFDELLDEVLRKDARTEPRPGIEQRILANVNAEVSRPVAWRRWLRLWLAPAGACLGLILVMQHGRREDVDSRVAGMTVADTHRAAATELKGMSLREERKHEEVASRVKGWGPAVVAKHVEESSEALLPKMETFPAVAQSSGFLPEMSGGGVKELREATDSPQVAQALQELKVQQEQPLKVSAIEIKPL